MRPGPHWSAYRAPITRLIRAIRLAFAFLTIVPVRFRNGHVSEADLAASRLAYPLVGLVIGLALAALSVELSRSATTPGLAAFVLIVAEVAIAGGLHLDGLADTADGLFLGGSAERRLLVMRDPHIGSFGVAAMVLTLLGKFAALSALTGRSRALAVLAAALIGRTLILVSAGIAPYARREGTGRLVVEATTPRDSVAAAGLVLVAGLLLGGPAGLSAACVTLVLAWSLTRLARDRLGGVTGDILGALVELGELVFLVTLGLLRPLG